MTLVLKANKKGIAQAAAAIAAGKLVAFPTETVYGLGANAFNAKAVKAIFKAKGRPADNPIIVHICDFEQLRQVAKAVSPKAAALAAFWPGPLTLILPKSKAIPPAVTAGLNKVAVRMPSNRIALELIRQAGVPIAAPSANISGRPSPTRAEHVLADLNGKVDVILDAGPTAIGLESTVVDPDKGLVLRPGGLEIEKIRQIAQVKLHCKSKRPASPGMKYRHYAPRAKLILVKSGQIEKVLESCKGKIGVLLFRKRRLKLTGTVVYLPPGKLGAKKYFSAIRELDKKCDIIVAELPKLRGYGIAIANRLEKAASEIR